MTPAQTKRLAREARKLAMECLTNGPQMVNLWCGCAIGICLKRARLWKEEGWRGDVLAGELEGEFSGGMAQYSPAAYGILSTATRERTRNGNPTAVVIPLLAWADFLDESPGNAATAAPKSTP